MTEGERKMIMALADTIKDEINRMCATKDLAELDVMYVHAREDLGNLSQMIYDKRFTKQKVRCKE